MLISDNLQAGKQHHKYKLNTINSDAEKQITVKQSGRNKHKI